VERGGKKNSPNRPFALAIGQKILMANSFKLQGIQKAIGLEEEEDLSQGKRRRKVGGPGALLESRYGHRVVSGDTRRAKKRTRDQRMHESKEVGRWKKKNSLVKGKKAEKTALHTN